MEQKTLNTNPLETEPVGTLIRRYSIPTATTLMVNYLYNIVDQIFVGQGVGVIGMAATNVAFPLTIVTMAISLMLGDGCAANISLCLGRKQQDEADMSLSHGITLLILSGILAAVLFFLSAPVLVTFLGATQTAYDASLLYTRIIVWGLPFLMFSSAFAAIIRADGNPQYTMKCMIIGAVINLILDPVFIFLFDMGVAGAGIATVIGEAASGLLCLRYIRHFKTVQVKRRFLRPKMGMSAKIIKLGIPSFITQILTAAVQICMNNHMTHYGSLSSYGSDIALSVYGMIMKVYQIAHSMFVGVSSATQPINGYNFGAKHYQRVKQTYRTAAAIGLLISLAWFAVYQLFPRAIGMLFVADDAVYLDACQHIFKLYMLGFFAYGLHMPTASFFQGIGRPEKSLAIPIVRQGLVLIPLSFILSSHYGLNGALLAAPVADLTSCFLSLILVKMEFRQWKAKGWIEA